MNAMDFGSSQYLSRSLAILSPIVEVLVPGVRNVVLVELEHSAQRKLIRSACDADVQFFEVVRLQCTPARFQGW